MSDQGDLHAPSSCQRSAYNIVIHLCLTPRAGFFIYFIYLSDSSESLAGMRNTQSRSLESVGNGCERQRKERGCLNA